MMVWEKYGIDVTKVRNGTTFCPKCHDSRKPQNRHKRELSVDLNSGMFNCHNDGCGFHGRAVEYEKPKKEFVAPPPRLQKVSDKTLAWFEKRGITNNTLLRFKVTEALEFMPQENKEMNSICFNYFRDEKLINIKFRDAKKNFKLVKDAELIFYNLDAIKDDKECVICEGEIDCLSFYEAGIYNCVSVPNGASKGNSRLEYLDNCIDYFLTKEKIIIATDGDEAGRSLKEELARRLGKEVCWLVNYPEQCKDANDVLNKYGKPAVKNLVDEAYQYPIDGVEKVKDFDDELMDIFENGYPSGQKIDYEEFDHLLSYRPGELTVITGSPNSGKSTFLNNILVKLANRHKWRVVFFSPEKQPNAILTAELIEILTGKPFHAYRHDERLKPQILAIAKQFIEEHFWFMKMSAIDASVEGIIQKSKELVVRYGIKTLVIDPWNYIEHNIPSDKNETQYVNESLGKLKAFKDKYGVHIFLVAHPTKLSKKDGKIEVPTLYQISGSAHFYNMSDNGIVVYRNMQDNITEVHVQKVRWFFVGRIGKADFKFELKNKRFTEINGSEFDEMEYYRNRDIKELEVPF